MLDICLFACEVNDVGPSAILLEAIFRKAKTHILGYPKDDGRVVSSRVYSFCFISQRQQNGMLSESIRKFGWRIILGLSWLPWCQAKSHGPPVPRHLQYHGV